MNLSGAGILLDIESTTSSVSFVYDVMFPYVRKHLTFEVFSNWEEPEYVAAFGDLVEPVVTAFDPELVLVSAGFDAHVDDPLAGMEVTEAGFTELARRSAQLGHRVAAVLEGGYNLATLPRLVDAALRGFDAG